MTNKRSSPLLSSPTALVIRTCTKDMRSHDDRARGFTWPTSGDVSAPDWDPKPECGHGLHGLLWGEGNGSLLSDETDAKWLVVEVESAHVVDLGDKVKYPRGTVIYCGNRDGAVACVLARRPESACIAKTVSVSQYKQASAGYRGQASAGDRGQASAGDSGQATAGDSGQATAGDSGQATAGHRGQASAGDRGQASAGDSGFITLRWWDSTNDRPRIEVGYVGENGIEAGVFYELDDQHKFRRCDPQPKMKPFEPIKPIVIKSMTDNET